MEVIKEAEELRVDVRRGIQGANGGAFEKGHSEGYSRGDVDGGVMAEACEAGREPKIRADKVAAHERRYVRWSPRRLAASGPTSAPPPGPLFATGHRRIGAGRRRGAVGSARRGRTRRATSWSPDLRQS